MLLCCSRLIRRLLPPQPANDRSSNRRRPPPDLPRSGASVPPARRVVLPGPCAARARAWCYQARAAHLAPSAQTRAPGDHSRPTQATPAGSAQSRSSCDDRRVPATRVPGTQAPALGTKPHALSANIENAYSPLRIIPVMLNAVTLVIRRRSAGCYDRGTAAL